LASSFGGGILNYPTAQGSRHPARMWSAAVHRRFATAPVVSNARNDPRGQITQPPERSTDELSGWIATNFRPR